MVKVWKSVKYEIHGGGEDGGRVAHVAVPSLSVWGLGAMAVVPAAAYVRKTRSSSNRHPLLEDGSGPVEVRRPAVYDSRPRPMP